MQIIKNFTPPDNASAFNPAKTVTVPANGTADLKLQGHSADIFGLNRILPYCSDLDAIEVEARLNNERIIFSGMQASAIRELFRDSELLAPLIIQKNNNLTFTLTNTSGGDLEVNMELLGYNGPSLRKLIQTYKDRSIDMPTPVFLYANKEIAHDTKKQSVNVPTKSVDVELLRAAVRTDSDADISVSLQLFNEVVKNDVFVQQFNDEFSNGRRAMVPLKITKNVPFTLNASNRSATAQTLSFLGEAYVYEN